MGVSLFSSLAFIVAAVCRPFVVSGLQYTASENGGSGSKDDSPSKANSSERERDVRLWVLEISPSGLTDTPRAHTVSKPVSGLAVLLYYLYPFCCTS